MGGTIPLQVGVDYTGKLAECEAVNVFLPGFCSRFLSEVPILTSLNHTLLSRSVKPNKPFLPQLPSGGL